MSETKVYQRPIDDGSATDLPELGLVGRPFATYNDDGTPRTTGVIRGEVGNGVFLVQRYCLHCRALADLTLFRIEDMLGWQFFVDADAMHRWIDSHTTIKPATRDDDDIDSSTKTKH